MMNVGNMTRPTIFASRHVSDAFFSTDTRTVQRSQGQLAPEYATLQTRHRCAGRTREARPRG
eukprot:859105-Prymnesium_polylepis.1